MVWILVIASGYKIQIETKIICESQTDVHSDYPLFNSNDLQVIKFYIFFVIIFEINQNHRR